MDKETFLNKMHEVIRQCEYDHMMLNDLWLINDAIPCDSDCEMDVGVDENDFIVIGGETTPFTVIDVSSIKYRAVEDGFAHVYIYFEDDTLLVQSRGYDCQDYKKIRIFPANHSPIEHERAFSIMRTLTADCKEWNNYLGCIVENDELLAYIGKDTEVIIPESVRVIGEGAFAGTNVCSVILSERTKEIGVRAFHDTKNLNSIDLRSIERIESYAFNYTPSLEQLIIPETLSFIGEKVFYCSGLKSSLSIQNHSSVTLSDNLFCDTHVNFPYE